MITFELGLYDFSESIYGNLLPLQEVLKKDGLANLFENKVFRLSSSAFLLSDENKIYLDGNAFFGQINLLSLQMEAASERLASGECALIRAANLNIEEGPFLAFEPTEDLINISFFYIPGSTFSSFYPIDGIAYGHSNKLYDYFKNNRTELLQTRKGTVHYSSLLGLSVYKGAVLDSLSREVQLVKKLFNRLGKDLDNEIYLDQMYE